MFLQIHGDNTDLDSDMDVTIPWVVDSDDLRGGRETITSFFTFSDK